MESAILAWALAQLEATHARSKWDTLPYGFELQAVQQVYRQIKPHFDKRAIKARIAASKAQTFAELRAVLLACAMKEG